MTINQLREVLLGFGEKLDDDEFKELIKSISVQSDGTINNDGNLNKIYNINL
jgi:Ca2+-binding EF-hand superfamily protein